MVISDEAEYWRAAMRTEMNSLDQNETWDLVDNPSKKALNVKWIYTKKAQEVDLYQEGKDIKNQISYKRFPTNRW